MINKLKPRSEFSHNVLTLLTGTIFAQAIPIAISPILTRLYSPEDFGLFALYQSLIMIFSSIVAGRYELAILIPKNSIDAKHIMAFSIMLSLIFSVTIFIFIIIFIDPLVTILGNENIKPWLYLAPFNIFILSATGIIYYWRNRVKSYKTLSRQQILQSSTQGTSNVLIGAFSDILGGMILGTFVGNISSLFYLIKNTLIDFKNFTFNKHRALTLLKKHSRFPRYMIASSFLENASSQLPIFLLGSFFGPSSVGYYALSQRVTRIPMMLIGSSVGSVFRQEASEQLAKSSSCRSLFITTFKKLFLIATAPFIFLYFIAPSAFALIFGENWRIAGEYSQILTPLFYAQFIASPLSSMFIIAEKQHVDLFMQIYLLISVFLSFFIGFKVFNSIEISLYIFTATYSVKYLVELYMSFKFTTKISVSVIE